jgi:Late embryogenesis abundant protein
MSSIVLYRRGFAAAAEEVRRGAKAEDKAAVAQLLAEKRVAAADPDPWVPDPVTGYYRPAKGAMELDAAELRAMLLSVRPKA